MICYRYTVSQHNMPSPARAPSKVYVSRVCFGGLFRQPGPICSRATRRRIHLEDPLLQQ